MLCGLLCGFDTILTEIKKNAKGSLAPIGLVTRISQCQMFDPKLCGSKISSKKVFFFSKYENFRIQIKSKLFIKKFRSRPV